MRLQFQFNLARIFGSQKIPAPTHEPQEQRVRSNLSNQTRCAREEAVPICRTDGDEWQRRMAGPPPTQQHAARQIFIAQTARERWQDTPTQCDATMAIPVMMAMLSDRNAASTICSGAECADSLQADRRCSPKAMSVASCNGQKKCDAENSCRVRPCRPLLQQDGPATSRRYVSLCIRRWPCGAVEGGQLAEHTIR